MVFYVDEVVVFNESGKHVEDFGNQFKGVGKKTEANVLLARILQYLECPQYLRKCFFPKHSDLQYAGNTSKGFNYVILAGQCGLPLNQGFIDTSREISLTYHNSLFCKILEATVLFANSIHLSRADRNQCHRCTRDHIALRHDLLAFCLQ